MKNTIKTNGRKRFTKRVEGEIAGKKRTINYIGNKAVSVTVENGKEIRISDNKYESLFKAGGVIFRVPEQSLTSRIVDEHPQFRVKGRIIHEYLIPACFRAGIIFKKEDKEIILTRNFHNQSGNPYSLPFGKTVLGEIEVQKCISYKGEEKIIINYIVNKIYDHNRDKEKGWKEIKITTTPPDDKNFFKIKIEPSDHFIIIK